MNDVMKLAKEQHSYVVDMRRHFHRNPEPSFKEFNTARKIRSELENMGIEWISACETGTVGIIHGNGDDPENILCLRADIDALELEEKTGCEYSSLTPGLMHGCGHDSHMAMLLGAARILKNNFEGTFPGTLYLLFQPAEENGNGAMAVIRSGALDGIKAMFGQHIMSYYDSGEMLNRIGPTMAGASFFHIDFKGKSGHGSIPASGINPVTPALMTALGLQTLVGLSIDPREIASLNIGQVTSGWTHNIIPETAHIEGCIRTFSKENDKLLQNAVQQWAQISLHIICDYSNAY